ncbi:PAS domain-containing protein [Argonema antarcticum]|uniref:PAS domain-containing protein n=1 Tax=Argonema antarcticum TaxID=2942763 RepID=UPI0020139BFC|nr:PAS domain-containing protein [Argonema antarcticum]MCL1472958.1 PAS domain-containing protein [Argonema antarcticum A004/B2]
MPFLNNSPLSLPALERAIDRHPITVAPDMLVADVLLLMGRNNSRSDAFAQRFPSLRIADISPQEETILDTDGEWDAGEVFLDKGKDCTVILRNYRKDGTLFWNELSIAPIYDRQGNLTHFIGVQTDISDRKQAEASLQQAKDQLRAVLDAVPGFVSWVSSDLRYLGVNQHLANAHNLPPDSFVGQDVGFMENSPHFSEFMRQFMAGSGQAASLIVDVKINQSTRNYLIATQKYHQGNAAVSVVKSMPLIHEKLYQSEGLAEIDASDYISNLAQNLFSSYNVSAHSIELHLEVERIILDIDTSVPCGLIINELMSNALKYAFTQNRKGKLSIGFTANNQNEIILTVSDDGVGLPPGFDIELSESLGLQLVYNLTEQLGGKIEIDCSNGASFKITFSR